MALLIRSYTMTSCNSWQYLGKILAKIIKNLSSKRLRQLKVCVYNDTRKETECAQNRLHLLPARRPIFSQLLIILETTKSTSCQVFAPLHTEGKSA